MKEETGVTPASSFVCLSEKEPPAVPVRIKDL